MSTCARVAVVTDHARVGSPPCALLAAAVRRVAVAQVKRTEDLQLLQDGDGGPKEDVTMALQRHDLLQ